MSATVGRALSLVGIVFALVGIFYLEGVSIEFPGIMLGAIGYYLGLRNGDRIGRVLGIATVVLCVIALGVSAFEAPPQ